MNEHDIKVIKILAEMGLHAQRELTNKEQRSLDRALRNVTENQEDFYNELMEIFGESNGRNN